MNNNRKSNQPIRLTEQDLHFLVEEAVKGYLVENGMDEGVWGGLKNVWNGVFGRNADGQRNGNFNFAQTYQAGNWASSFAKYEKQVQKIIKKMIQVARNSNNKKVVIDLYNVSEQFENTAKEFNEMAKRVASTRPQVNTTVNSKFKNNNTTNNSQYGSQRDVTYGGNPFDKNTPTITNQS